MDKKLLRKKIKTLVIKTILENVKNDDEYYLALIYANAAIACELSDFEDIVE